MNDPVRVFYRPSPAAKPEAERSALATVYKFLLEAHISRKGAVAGGTPDDARRSDDRADRRILP